MPWFAKINILKVSIVFLIIIKSLIWLSIFPPFQTPDENMHFAHVQFIAEKNRLIRSEKDAVFNKELIESMNILGLHRIAHQKSEKFLDSDKYDKVKKKISALNTEKDRHDFAYGKQTAYLYPPLYYGVAAIFYKAFYSYDLLTRYNAVRIFSVLISLGILYFVYISAKELFQNELTSLLAVLIVAFHPMFSMMSISINPDNLIALLAAALFYLAIKSIKDKNLTFRNNIYMTICAALSLLTKQYFVVLFFMYLVTLVILFFFEKLSIKKIMANLSAFIVVNLLVASSWWLNHVSSARASGVSKLGLMEYLGNQGFKYFTFVVDSAWAIFGWLDTRINIENFHFIFLAALFIMIFGAIYAYMTESDPFIKNALLLMFSSFCFLVFFLFYIDFKYSYDLANNFIQGRYYLVLMASNTLLLLLSLMVILKRKYDELVAFSVFILMLFLNLISVYSYIIPRYFI